MACSLKNGYVDPLISSLNSLSPHHVYLWSSVMQGHMIKKLVHTKSFSILSVLHVLISHQVKQLAQAGATNGTKASYYATALNAFHGAAMRIVPGYKSRISKFAHKWPGRHTNSIRFVNLTAVDSGSSFKWICRLFQGRIALICWQPVSITAKAAIVSERCLMATTAASRIATLKSAPSSSQQA